MSRHNAMGLPPLTGYLGGKMRHFFGLTALVVGSLLVACGGSHNNGDIGGLSGGFPDGGTDPNAEAGVGPSADGGSTTEGGSTTGDGGKSDGGPDGSMKDTRIDPIEVGHAWTYNVTVLGYFPACSNGVFVSNTLSTSMLDGKTALSVPVASGIGLSIGPRTAGERGGGALMAVNIDEGEPGTFKDRTYLERDPHRFLEGLLIAANVVGIDACYIYLRDEYHGCRAILEAELARLKANPPYPSHIPLPHIELRRGAGAYICGEESAMIESIEGKRGEPRMRPPYIAEVGLFGRPTLEHNFETLYWVRDIVDKGPAWFSGFGRNGRKGLRSFSVSGRIKHPGVKLAPAGITLQELIDEYCGGMLDGHTLYAYLPGGASGGIFPASLANIPLDFDTLQPHGGFIGSAAVIVLGHHDKARDAALNMMRFFEHESCGQCTPCRVGTAKAAKLMTAPVWDNATLEDLNIVMTDASICGLGQAAPNPVRCVQKYFAHEIGGSP